MSNLNGTRTFDVIYHNGIYATGYDIGDNGAIWGGFGGDGCLTVYEWTLSSFGDIFTTTSGFTDETKWLRDTTVRLRLYVEFYPTSMSGLTQDLLYVFVYSVYLDDTFSPAEWIEALVWSGQAPAPDNEAYTTTLDWFCDCTAAAEALIHPGIPGLEALGIVAYSLTDTHTGPGGWGGSAFSVVAYYAATAYSATPPDPFTILGNCDKISAVP
jgi:hypothetical protein